MSDTLSRDGLEERTVDGAGPAVDGGVGLRGGGGLGISKYVGPLLDGFLVVVVVEGFVVGTVVDCEFGTRAGVTCNCRVSKVLKIELIKKMEGQCKRKRQRERGKEKKRTGEGSDERDERDEIHTRVSVTNEVTPCLCGTRLLALSTLGIPHARSTEATEWNTSKRGSSLENIGISTHQDLGHHSTRRAASDINTLRVGLVLVKSICNH